MEYVTLGRTGLMVSVAGLGCGGFSRLGLGTGKTEAQAVALIRQALDLGVNLLDTAAKQLLSSAKRSISGSISSTPLPSTVLKASSAKPSRACRATVS